MRLLFTALACLISVSVVGQELKYIDGDIFLNSQEISIKDAQALALQNDCFDATFFFKKAKKYKKRYYVFVGLAMIEGGVGGALVGLGMTAGLVSIGASMLTLFASCLPSHKKHEEMILSGVNSYNGCFNTK